MNDSLLHQLATRAHIERDYRDMWGNRHEAPEATVLALLQAMGLAAGSHDEIVASLARLDARSDMSPSLKTAAHAWLPPALADGERRWGLAVQLYALRTARTWGIGDFSALADLLRGTAALGACAVGVNPMHALFPTRPEHASPYSPSSRRFINPLYIDVEAVDDFAACKAARNTFESRDFQAQLRDARAAERVAYTRVASLKFSVLIKLYKHFRKSCLGTGKHARGLEFRQFQNRQGPPLRHFATFHALLEVRSEIDWRQWPEALGNPDSPAVAAFAMRHVEAIEFHEYLQWQARLQLARVEDAARACDMSIGLFTDLAVGADPTGAECWDTQTSMVQGATVGAPPDALNLLGQNWGLLPPDPLALAGAAYDSVRELWDANMHHAGALRIDHIMGLARLYWIPTGASATEGAYVLYPWHDLLGLLAAQSQRNRCLIVGEDLGTVPEGLREAMHALDILSYRLLYFEQQDGRFRSPRDYPEKALVATSTHDLPSLPMWWDEEDIDLRQRLGLWPDDDARQAECDRRQQTRGALIDALQREGLHSGDMPDAAPVEAIHAYLARTPCKLLMVQLEDVLGLHVQINLPGTTDEHPNWRQRLPCSVDDALAHPRMQRIAAIMHDNGRSDR